jgi:toxin-antitoxin system PIN domain toxin
MVALLDVNVLVALAWPTHLHHVPAHAWFRVHNERGWATCPVTQAGFVRVSSNHRVLPNAKSPQEALALLQRIVALPHHVFWEDDTALSTTMHMDATKLLGHAQVTDAHLLALTLRRRGRLVSFDQGVRSLVPRGVSADVVVTPAT